MADRRAEDRAAASQSALKKPWDAIQKEVAKYYKASDLQKVAGSSERVHNIDEVNQHIIEETYWEFEAWKEANPKASIAMQNKMRSEITYKTFSKYEKTSPHMKLTLTKCETIRRKCASKKLPLQ